MSLYESFVMSSDLKARFKRAENKSNTQMSVQMHSRAAIPPVTYATNSTATPAPQYAVVVGNDAARALYLFEEVAFEEVDPTRAYDAITFANYGLYDDSVEHIAGPIVYEPPAIDRAIRTTVEDSVLAPSPVAVRPGSFEFWVRTSEVVGSPTVIASILNGPDSVDPDTALKITLNTDGTLTASAHDDTDALLYDDDHPVVVNDGDWHHIVAVDSGSAMSLYVDGALT